MTALFRHFLRKALYLAAILLLPGALIGAPLLWWLGHRRAMRTAHLRSSRTEGIDGESP